MPFEIVNKNTINKYKKGVINNSTKKIYKSIDLKLQKDDFFQKNKKSRNLPKRLKNPQKRSKTDLRTPKYPQKPHRSRWDGRPGLGGFFLGFWAIFG